MVALAGHLVLVWGQPFSSLAPAATGRVWFHRAPIARYGIHHLVDQNFSGSADHSLVCLCAKRPAQGEADFVGHITNTLA
jgi:hypothetical protein